LGGCADLAGAARGEVGSVVDGVVAAGLATWDERWRFAGARRGCGAEEVAVRRAVRKGRRVGGAVFSW
jgi:hypothetical protein